MTGPAGNGGHHNSPRRGPLTGDNVEKNSGVINPGDLERPWIRTKQSVQSLFRCNMKKDFCDVAVRLCERIALRLGKDEGYNRVYKDGKIRIIRSMHSREMTVVIFPPFTGATTGNPALMVDEGGKTFRWHGEMYRAEDHIWSVYCSIPGNENHEEGS